LEVGVVVGPVVLIEAVVGVVLGVVGAVALDPRPGPVLVKLISARDVVVVTVALQVNLSMGHTQPKTESPVLFKREPSRQMGVEDGFFALGGVRVSDIPKEFAFGEFSGNPALTDVFQVRGGVEHLGEGRDEVHRSGVVHVVTICVVPSHRRASGREGTETDVFCCWGEGGGFRSY